MIGSKSFRWVRRAFNVALFLLGLLSLIHGDAAGGGAVVAAAILTRDDLESILEQIFETADECGPTKSEMEVALAEITDLADPDTALEQDSSGKWSVAEDSGPQDDDEDEEDLEG